MTALATSPLEPGQRIDGRYEIVSALGSGAIGRVFHVLDHELEQQSFALKIIHDHLRADSSLMQRFSGEAVLSRQLTHQNIVRVYEFVASARHAYLVMEFVDGCSIEQLLSGTVARAISIEESFYLLEQVLNGLGAAHQIDIVHRDLKPSNVLVDRNGIVKLSDFGVAASLKSPMGLTKTGELIGTPSFMAPEQFRSGPCDARTDLYAFAIVAFEMLTGELAFSGNTPYEVMHAQQRSPFPNVLLANRGIPNWCIEALSVCANKDPKLRTYSAAQLAAYFREKLSSGSTETSQTSIGTRVRARRNWQGLLPVKVANILRVWWIVSTLIVFVAVLYDINARRRIGTDLIRIHHEFGIGVTSLLSLLQLGEFSGFTVDDLYRFSTTGKLRQARMLLDSGIAERSDPAELLSTLSQLREHSFPEFIQLLNWVPESVFVPEFVQATYVKAAVHDAVAVAVKMLNRGANPLATDLAGNTVLHITAEMNLPRSVKRTLQMVRPDQAVRLSTLQNLKGNTALHLAVNARNTEVLEELLLHGFPADVRDREGRTPLMLVLSLRKSPVSESIFWMLVNASADLSACDNHARCIRQYAESSANAEWITELEQAQISSTRRGAQ